MSDRQQHNNRLTMPIAEGHELRQSSQPLQITGTLALDERWQVALRRPCGRCNGHGTLPEGTVVCPRCHQSWSSERQARYQGYQWDVKRLICGCPLDKERLPQHIYQPCDNPRCQDGWIHVYVGIDPLIEAAMVYIAENYESFSQALTAILPKLPRAM